MGTASPSALILAFESIEPQTLALLVQPARAATDGELSTEAPSLPAIRKITRTWCLFGTYPPPPRRYACVGRQGPRPRGSATCYDCGSLAREAKRFPRVRQLRGPGSTRPSYGASARRSTAECSAGTGRRRPGGIGAEPDNRRTHHSANWICPTSPALVRAISMLTGGGPGTCIGCERLGRGWRSTQR
jgi:hypothetical protein